MDTEDKKKQTSNSDKKATGRRKLLKSVVAGGGAVTVAKVLPDQWARPVVDSVMLPSHAETSMPGRGPFVSSNIQGMTETERMMAEQGFSEELLEFFTPAAHAGEGGSPDAMRLNVNDSGNSYLCADRNNDPSEVVTVQIQNTNPLSFTGSNPSCLFEGEILGGKFNKNVGWVVSILPPRENVSVNVTLTSGGVGCTGNEDPGRCRGPR
ncbi:MAG: hypothetical protein QNL05_10670 [Gammaproteobacteria bacterium]|nr:hypothetical protein [Gammaproteobacteria bacterium]MDX2488034.1 hypothetical protein [Gammaproteobacteria bacterium]